ncbi:hypothetical protein HK105_206333 [Polyrhizophydium stewartii]|uniref:Uncharacterized protein n=1 Tax=Polyrhizophydium stewartii TaxID=2732419 RepID=A0ABR4N3M3_9FUNG
MQIRIGPARSPAPASEPVLVELQGALEAQGIVAQDNRLALAGVHVGELCVTGDKAHLYIQNHVLEGSRVSLAKPLVMIAKSPAHQPLDGVPAGDRTARASSEQPVVQYEVVHIIRHKFHFKTRPEHLVNVHHQGLAALTPRQFVRR